MFDRIYRQTCEYIKHGNYVVTLHAEEEMAADNLTILDVEEAILTGQIIERQRDAATDEYKYLIKGKSLLGSAVTVAVKLSVTRKLIMITVFGSRPTNGKLR